MYYYHFEVARACDIAIRELLALKPDETIVVTADTGSDPHLVEAAGAAAFAAGAKPMVIWVAKPLVRGKAGDQYWPLEALVGVLRHADAWLEFNSLGLLYSTAYDRVMKENTKLRYLCLANTDSDMMVRCIGRINYPVLKEFLNIIAGMTRNAKRVRVTSPAGTQVEFNMPKTKDGKPDPNRLYTARSGYADVPGAHMMGGQIGGVPDCDTINGMIVFDGSFGPVIGKLDSPIRLTVKSGEIVKIEGGRQAAEFEAWVKGFNHPQMLRIAHFNYGFNPGSTVSGKIIEDERVWGCTEWGLGALDTRLLKPDGIWAPGHGDGICLNSSVWLDGEQIMDCGKMVKPNLVELAKKLGKA